MALSGGESRFTGMERHPSSRVWAFAGCMLDERTLELKVAGNVVELERKQLEVLLHLLRHAGEIVTKDELAEAVWPGRITTDSNLTKTMAVLRAGLGAQGQGAIKTVHGYGYRLVAPVSVQTSAADPGPPRFDFRPGECPPLRPLWRLESRLGTGGQGEVWLARHAATKEARVFKFAAEGRALSALKREITLNRLLRETLPDRRDFLRLLDWNVEEPPFFIESEFVAGGNLAIWAEAKGGLGAIPLDQRLAVLAAVAEAVGAAHSVGVLHKDLKPGNVLVVETAEGASIKLADFGSGGVIDPHALEAHGITRMGFTQTVKTGRDTSGTPLYLAPEVLAGQPFTVQSDIYALGAILYQLVTGDFRKMLAPGWEKDVGDELLREDIVAAAAGNPADRLAGATQFAQRLRMLEQRRASRRREAEARAASERASAMRQQLRRLRLLAAVLVAAIVAVSGAASVAVRARDDARKSAAVAEAVTQFLNNDLIAGMDPANTPVRDISMRALLDRASETVDQRFAAEPEAAARVHLQLGLTYGNLGDYAQAATHVAKAAELAGPTAAGHEARMYLARILNADGKGRESCAMWREVVVALSGLVPAGDVRLLAARADAAGMCEDDPDRAARELADVVAAFQAQGLTASPEYERALAGHAGTLEMKGDFAAAAPQSRKLVDLLSASLGPHHARTARARVRFAEVLINLGELAEADAQLQIAFEDLERWGANPFLTMVYGDLALLRVEQGRFEEAETAINAAFGQPGGVHISGLRPILAEALLQQGRVAEVIVLSRDTVAQMRSRNEKLEWFQLKLVGAWAEALRRQGRVAEAHSALATVTAQEWTGIPDSAKPDLDVARARLLIEDGRRAEATALLRSTLAILQKYCAPDSWRIAEVKEILAKLGT